MKKIFITGITGYIGSQLAKFLTNDNAVYGIVREHINMRYLQRDSSQISLLHYDGTSDSIKTALEIAKPDIVFHLATYYTGARSPQIADILAESNIHLGMQLLEAMCEVGCKKIVYATTVTTQRAGNGYQPLSLYAATKQAFSDIISYYTDAELMQAVELVLPDTYGPNDERPKVLNLIKKAALRGEPMSLTSGEQFYDVIYIDDVVRGFASFLDAQAWHESYNHFQLTSGKEQTLRAVVETLLCENKLEWQPQWGEKPDAFRQAIGGVQIFPLPPNWKPQVSLEEGLKRFWKE
jgi:nucleoside-diphosphate-sugar epimerase